MYKNIKIKFETYNLKLLKNIISKFKINAKKNFLNKIKIIGPVYLPVKKRIYCVLTSPHVNKNAREHFEIKRHKQIIIVNFRDFIELKKLLNIIKIPSGLSIKIN